MPLTKTVAGTRAIQAYTPLWEAEATTPRCPFY